MDGDMIQEQLQELFDKHAFEIHEEYETYKNMSPKAYNDKLWKEIRDELNEIGKNKVKGESLVTFLNDKITIDSVTGGVYVNGW